MALTQEHVMKLTAHFAPEQHEFDYRGNVYIKELPISGRLDSVDPAWSLSEPKILWRDGVGGKVVEVTLVLTVHGVSRGGVGRKDVEPTKNGKSEANQAAKAATTDAFKRAARMFGIGRYLLETPDNVKNVTAIENWLNPHTKKQGDNNAGWQTEVKQLTQPLYIGSDGKFNSYHQSGSLNKARDENAINSGQAVLVTVAIMLTRRLVAQHGMDIEEIEVMLNDTVLASLTRGQTVNEILAQADLFFASDNAKEAV